MEEFSLIKRLIFFQKFEKGAMCPFSIPAKWGISIFTQKSHIFISSMDKPNKNKYVLPDLIVRDRRYEKLTHCTAQYNGQSGQNLQKKPKN